jgi:hypothetical protein
MNGAELAVKAPTSQKTEAGIEVSKAQETGRFIRIMLITHVKIKRALLKGFMYGNFLILSRSNAVYQCFGIEGKCNRSERGSATPQPKKNIS